MITASQPAPLMIEPTPDNAGADTTPIMLKLFEMAKRHLGVIAAIMGLSIAVALIFTLLSTPLYTAETRIEIAREQANVTNVERLQDEGASQAAEFYGTQHALLGARSLAERVTRRLRLTGNRAFAAAYKLDSPAGGRLTRAERDARERQIADILLGDISITPLRNSALVDVSYTSPNPQISAEIANAWVNEFIRQSMDRRFGSTADARAYLEGRLEGLRQRLEQSERDLVNYARTSGIVRLGEERSVDGRTVTTQTLATADVTAINAELASATADRIAAEGRRDAVRSHRASELLVGNQAIGTLRQRRTELAAQYARLMQQFEPQYPEAQSVQRQIAALDASIAAEERRVIAAVDSTYDAALRREQGLRARIDGLLGRLDTQNRATIQYNIYQREVDTNRQLYDGLLQRYKEIGVAGVGTNNILIVDSAEAPGSPSSPKLWLNLALALMIGTLLASVVVFAIENLDEAIRRPQQITEKLRVALLGAVPQEAARKPMDLLADPKSSFSEAYMSVRTNLGFTTDHGAPRSFSITSTSASEGKSTTSLAIAVALARTGKRAILLDVDLRRPAMARALGLHRENGVSNYLAGNSQWQSLVQPSGYAGLDFMASGPIPPSAPELLSGERLAKLIEELGQAYDHVIIDGPPMLALSDALLIARAVEGVVFVVEAGRTPIRAVAATISRLQESGAHLFGVILTKYRAQASTYGFGYNYGHEYSYHREQAD